MKKKSYGFPLIFQGKGEITQKTLRRFNLVKEYSKFYWFYASQ